MKLLHFVKIFIAVVTKAKLLKVFNDIDCWSRQIDRPRKEVLPVISLPIFSIPIAFSVSHDIHVLISLKCVVSSQLIFSEPQAC